MFGWCAVDWSRLGRLAGVVCAAQSLALAISPGRMGLSRGPGWVTAAGRVQGASAGLSACSRTDRHHLAVTGRYPVARAPWTGSWTGRRVHLGAFCAFCPFFSCSLCS